MKHLLRKLGAVAIILFALNIAAQEVDCQIDPTDPSCPQTACTDGPCAGDCALELIVYDASNGGCQPCWKNYEVVYDIAYGVACNAFCANPTAPCAPSRVTVTSGPAQCSVNLTFCSVTYPYYCTLITSETDICNGELCSQTQGPPYCTNQQPSPTGSLRERGNHAKAVLATLRARNRRRS